MTDQFNIRLPAKARKQLQNMRSWSGMNDTQLTIEAIDHLYQEYKREHETPTGWSAYRRDVNAGWGTETILLFNGIILDQLMDYTQPGYEIESRTIIGKMIEDVRDMGFKRITKEQEIKRLKENYQARLEEMV